MFTPSFFPRYPIYLNVIPDLIRDLSLEVPENKIQAFPTSGFAHNDPKNQNKESCHLDL